MKIITHFLIESSPCEQAFKNLDFSDLKAYEARLALLELSILADYDELLCLPNLIDIDKHWYQLETAKKVIKQFGGRAILADEVGLGKTVEAGIICQEYFSRGMIKSLLVLTPATLVSQWQSELAEKFHISTFTNDQRSTSPREFWQQNDKIIASYNVAKHASHWDYCLSREWDLVIVDEAHHLKNKASKNWKLVNALKKRFILLLTATPVQNNLMELYNLLTLIKPGLLSTEAEFKKEYVKSKNGRVPKNPEQLQQLMREVMIRNTRAVVDVKLPKRFATTIACHLTGLEQELYESINQYLRQHPDELDQLTRNHLLMRAGSSPQAILESLKRLSERFEHDEIKFLIKRAKQVKESEKAKQLIKLLKEGKESKTLIFINHRATQTFLSKALTEAGIPHTDFRGNMSLKAKDAAIEEFRESVPVMLASETGGEGRNLQFANTIVNYDLPLNPMKIEQRIGRLHRIGQTQDVFIFNFCLVGSLEEYVLKILHEKINLFELVVGEIDTILGNMGEDFDFGETVISLWLNHQSDRERETAFEELGSQLVNAKQIYTEVKEYDEQLFGENLEA